LCQGDARCSIAKCRIPQNPFNFFYLKQPHNPGQHDNPDEDNRL
jgi:hypothetical protein